MLFGILCLVALGIAVALWFQARKQRAATGLPFGARIVYADTGAWSKIEQPLFSPRYVLAGKPDYIVHDQGAMIPIEVKPNQTAPSPYESDVMQLVAYGLLIEETYGTFPRYGLLKYRDVVFQIDFTAARRAQVIALIPAMQQRVNKRPVARQHTDPGRCRKCGYRAECGQALESFCQRSHNWHIAPTLDLAAIRAALPPRATPQAATFATLPPSTVVGVAAAV